MVLSSLLPSRKFVYHTIVKQEIVYSMLIEVCKINSLLTVISFYKYNAFSKNKKSLCILQLLNKFLVSWRWSIIFVDTNLLNQADFCRRTWSMTVPFLVSFQREAVHIWFSVYGTHFLNTQYIHKNGNKEEKVVEGEVVFVSSNCWYP